MGFLEVKFGALKKQMRGSLPTLGVMFMLTIQAFSLILVPFVSYYMVVHTRLWWTCILYFAWYLIIDWNTPGKGGRRWEWVRNWSCWMCARDYFPLKMVKLPLCELDPKRNYIFCCFPHGMLATGIFLSLATNATGFDELFPHHTPHAHTISLLFKMPFLREIVMWLGALPVTEGSINYVQAKEDGGSVSGIAVGGAVEAYYCKPGLNKLVFKKRKGFVRIALKNGSPLVPVYSFGETDLYSQWEVEENSFFDRFRNAIKKMTGFTIVLLKGRGLFQHSFGFLPQRNPVTVVVGEPIDVQKTENPTQEQIDNLHQLFEKKLVELFESQKKYYVKDHETAHLEIL